MELTELVTIASIAGLLSTVFSQIIGAISNSFTQKRQLDIQRSQTDSSAFNMNIGSSVQMAGVAAQNTVQLYSAIQEREQRISSLFSELQSSRLRTTDLELREMRVSAGLERVIDDITDGLADKDDPTELLTTVQMSLKSVIGLLKGGPSG